MTRCRPARRRGQRGRVGPAGHRLARHLDGDRGQPGGQRGIGGQLRVPGLAVGQLAQPVIVDQVGPGDHAERPGGHPGQVGQALRVGLLAVQQLAGEHPLGQVVHPAPAVPPDADDFAHVQQPLDGDLRVRPVPPRAAGLGPAQLGRVQRAVRAQPGQHLGAGPLVALVPAAAPGAQRPAPERVPRPLLDRQHARRVRPVLERGRAARIPVGPLDPLPRHRAEPGVGDQLVRAGQHADRVQLDRADPAQHAGTPPRRPSAPRKPCARSVISRASSADRDSSGAGCAVLAARWSPQNGEPSGRYRQDRWWPLPANSRAA